MKITLVANGPLLIETEGEWSWPVKPVRRPARTGSPCAAAALPPPSPSVTVRTERSALRPRATSAS